MSCSPRSSTSAASPTTSTSPTSSGPCPRAALLPGAGGVPAPLTGPSACRYISILVELTRLEGTRHGHLIAAQMLDVAIRVKAIRKFAVSQMSALLDSAHLVTSSTQRNGICEVLYAAAWICGEFSE